MGAEGEAAGDVLTGAVIGGTVEHATNAAGKQTAGATEGTCLNCGAQVTGAYCSACGQRLHLHRTLTSIGHDILHGVFHFEGKLWRTLPELFLRPGQLTRRYIDGERAKFISPMALYLFTVFVMFAVISFTTMNFTLGENSTVEDVKREFQANNQSVIEQTNEQIALVKRRLEDPSLTDSQRTDLQEELAGLEASVKVVEGLSKGDLKVFAELQEAKARKAKNEENRINVGWPAFDERMTQAVRDINENPRFLLYKLKTNGYKYSWALIPLSLPFMWILFFWRRDIHLYDHAIFVTYSLTFMMMLMILLSIASAFGMSGYFWPLVLGVVPPLHMYKQLRGAYGLSRFGAWVRLFVLLIATTIVLSIFAILLVLIGVVA